MNSSRLSSLRVILIAHVLCCSVIMADEGKTKSSNATEPEERLNVAKMQFFEGFFNFYWDDSRGKVWLEIRQFDFPFLYVNSLATGLGSNPVGLDRGQLGRDRVVHFHRVGDRAFLIHENLKYRATSSTDAERQTVRDSFASSVLWGAEIKVTTTGSLVTDMTNFLIRDAHHCVQTLAQTGQGAYELDKNRSFVHMPRTKSFPKNTEFEVATTFSSKSPGPLSRRVAADGGIITLRQHHSFIELPDAKYMPRRFDPRAGAFAITYSDYAAPIDKPLEQRFITRHRLQKRDPRAAVSPPIEPIVYYVDPGVPEPIRSALVDGAKWWNEAFESAGFVDAFHVRILPVDADPMDVRYNVMQWVHRATRGWSYGSSVVDPRTGEIIKGHVSLGSLRVRHDYMLNKGIHHSTSAACFGCCGLGGVPSEPYLSGLAAGQTSIEVALARIRQLSAHEVGHTLGFAHNFAASTYGDRASVMDYPAPRARIVDGQIDLSDAYGVGVGSWDKFAVRYAYSEFPASEEEERLNQLVQQSIESQMLYITDADARPAGAAHPLGNLWDNGSDPVSALRHEMNVRRIAIERFDESVIDTGTPLAEIGRAFVPVYLHHRYQLAAAVKVVGGIDYSYAVKGDGRRPMQQISADQQRVALRELLLTLHPDSLVIPDRIVKLIPPKVVSSATDRELFTSTTSPMFDPGIAARVAADLALAGLLQPQRASRLSAAELGELGLAEMIGEIFEAAFPSEPAKLPSHRRVYRIVQSVLAERLMRLAESTTASSDARATASAQLDMLRTLSVIRKRLYAPGSVDSAHLSDLAARIQRFKDRPHQPASRPNSVEMPPGSPIGLNRTR